MAANALAPHIDRSSAAILLAMLDKQTIVFNREQF